MDTRATTAPEVFLTAREYESRKDERSTVRKGSETKPWMIAYAITLGILCIPAVVLPVLTGVVALLS